MSEPTGEYPAVEPNWDRTISRAEMLRLTKSKFFEEPDGADMIGEERPDRPVDGRPAKYGWYKNRHIIGRDERIDGGVYLGAGNREEIVVDGKGKPEQYDIVYSRLMQNVRIRQDDQARLGERNGFKDGILSDVYDTVQQVLAYDDEFVDATASQYAGQKVDLNYYIESGKGVCRHQALLAGYLLERLKDEGQISGQASVDRNSVRGRGAHAWTRYTSSTGDVFIIDPTQDYVGRLDEVPENSWFYRRPEDI